jgi:two-component system, cell cycle response regulator
MQFYVHNDSYGHPEGDKCLRKVSSCLQEFLRKPCDFVARYGGEEFIVVLPETDSREAAIIAERLREKVVNLKIRHKNSAVSRYVSISIGIAYVVPDKSLSLKQLLIYADKALYQVKTDGRNCVRSLDVTRQTDGFTEALTN